MKYIEIYINTLSVTVYLSKYVSANNFAQGARFDVFWCRFRTSRFSHIIRSGLFYRSSCNHMVATLKNMGKKSHKGLMTKTRNKSYMQYTIHWSNMDDSFWCDSIYVIIHVLVDVCIHRMSGRRGRNQFKWLSIMSRPPPGRCKLWLIPSNAMWWSIFWW